MSSDLIRCCVCLVDYDLDTYSPVMLSQCGHNTCETCAKSLVVVYPMECPLCRKKFPQNPNDTKYVPNRQIREQLERESQYQRCPVHDQLMEFYCKADKHKVCVDCLFTKGEESHKNHDVERIVDLKEQLDSKKKIYEECQEKCRMTYEAGKNLINKSKLEQVNSAKELEFTAKLVALEAKMRAKGIFDQQEAKIEEDYGSNSASRKELSSKINQYQDLKNSDLNALFEDNVEDMTKRFHVSQSKEYLEKFAEQVYETGKQFIGPKITQDDTKISIEAPKKFSSLKIDGHLSFQLEGECLTITANNVRSTDMTLDLDRWDREVKKIKFVFDKFDFNDDDMFIITYIWTRLQLQIISVVLSYRDIEHGEVFTDHLADFPKLVFSHPEILQGIGLIFNKTNGCSYLVERLVKRILPRFSNINSLEIGSIDSDLKQQVLQDLALKSKALLNGLNHFSLILSEGDGSGRRPQQKLINFYLDLPNLKSFHFSDSFFPITNHFIQDSLKAMKSLESLEFHSQTMKDHNLETLLILFGSMPTIKSLKITLPAAGDTQLKIEGYKAQLRSKGVGLERIEINIKVLGGGIFANTISNSTNSRLFAGTNPTQNTQNRLFAGNSAQPSHATTASIATSSSVFSNSSHPSSGPATVSGRGLFSGNGTQSQSTFNNIGSLFPGTSATATASVPTSSAAFSNSTSQINRPATMSGGSGLFAGNGTESRNISISNNATVSSGSLFPAPQAQSSLTSFFGRGGNRPVASTSGGGLFGNPQVSIVTFSGAGNNSGALQSRPITFNHDHHGLDDDESDYDDGHDYE